MTPLEQQVTNMQIQIDNLIQQNKEQAKINNQWYEQFHELKTTYERLHTVTEKIIATMQTPLNELMEIGRRHTAVYEDSLALSDEDMAVLRMNYYKASRRIERAYAESVLAIVDYQQGA